MTQEEKEILLKVLCAMLPYTLYGLCGNQFERENDIEDTAILDGIVKDGTDTILCARVLHPGLIACHQYFLEDFKPYLRSMSSMTDEEKIFLNDIVHSEVSAFEHPVPIWCVSEYDIEKYVNFCNSHHLDWRCLIEKGLALEAPDGMYN